MTPDEQRGRNIVLLISAAIVLPQALAVAASLATSHTAPLGMAAIRLGIAAIMSYLMWRGHSAARTYLAFTLFLGAGLTLVGSLALLVKTPFAVVGILLGAGYIWAAWVLWKSPKVEAYIEAREKARNPSLSFRDGNGV